jgi:hypothetical protein
MRGLTRLGCNIAGGDVLGRTRKGHAAAMKNHLSSEPDEAGTGHPRNVQRTSGGARLFGRIWWRASRALHRLFGNAHQRLELRFV